MGFVRSIGRWGLVFLTVNCIIGSGIFGVPGVLIGMVGRASPLAMMAAGLGMAIIVSCYAEVASQFPEPGGSYLYAHRAFGSFAGMQVGWFDGLSIVGGTAANANLFVIYMAGLAPGVAHGWPRMLVITVLILVPAAANYIGVRSGSNLSSALTLAKLIPLAALIALGLTHFTRNFQVIHASEIAAPGWRTWFDALLLLVFSYSGCEDAVKPMGEVRDPRRNIPLALIAGITLCIAVYTLLQFVVAANIGPAQAERPLAAAAALLIGKGGPEFIEIAAMISTYGYISACLLGAPRLFYSLAAQGEFPAVFGRMSRRFNTPHVSILLFAAMAWLLATTGTFRWTLAISAASSIVMYAVVCAALLRLRRLEPGAPGFHLPGGRALAITGIVIALLLLSRLERRELLLMSVTAAIAAGNWWWVKHRRSSPAAAPAAVVSALD